ncbi:MAG TPA: glycosyltransferase family 1 protein [Ardenticatenaceae bacterium]|nr:glycosyltransferase family 1 protein [Ardenticatenaceae bacterium]
MRVCLDISAALGQGAGIGRYARELALALHRLPNGPDLVLFHNRQPGDQFPPELMELPRAEVPLGNKSWRALMLTGQKLPATWLAELGDYDIFHGTDMVAPDVPKPTVVTIHDLSTLLYPEHHTRLHRLHLQWALPRTIKRAAAIITDASSTKRDLVARCAADPDRIHVIHLGVNHERFFARYRPEARQRAGRMLGIEPPYVLALGTLEPRKNLPTLLHAYARLGPTVPKLVLAGARGWGEGPLFDLVRTLGLQDRVRFTGYVPEAVLPDLYAGSRLFVYPSLYEGFGLPVLEALACGAPVITSSSSSLPEVAGEAALFVDPTSVDALAEAMWRVLDNKRLRDDLRAKGPKHAARFNWERTARETLAVYDSVVRTPLTEHRAH